ncbi:ABC transporter [Bradyrhizobium sp. HKCCYLRH3061]
MPGLVPGIHVAQRAPLVVDGRGKPGHDGYGFGATFAHS